MRYDLAAVQSLWDVKLERGGRWVLYPSAAFFVAVLVYATVLFLSHPSGSFGLYTFLEVLVFCGVFIALLLLPTRRMGSNPSYLDVDSAGFSLAYPGGRVWKKLWIESDFEVTVVERVLGSITERPIPRIIAIAGRAPVRNFITSEALDGLLTVAAAQGLSIVQDPKLRGGWRFTRIARASC